MNDAQPTATSKRIVKPTQLVPGKPAPDFTAVAVSGKTVSLADYKGKKLLICFFRYAGCPFCNLALHRLQVAVPQLEELGLNIVAFMQSEPENIQRYIYERHTPAPTFPIIADPDRTYYNLYGVQESVKPLSRAPLQIPSWLKATLWHGYKQGKIDGSVSMVPAHFMTDPYDGTIYKASYSSDYFQDWPMIEILDYAQFGAVHNPDAHH